MAWPRTLTIARYLVLACGLATAFTAPATNAAEKKVPATDKALFRGVEITPFFIHYLVRKDVNIRSLPTQKSKKVGRLEEGERIRGVGKAKKDWVAYQDEGKDIGFVYAPVLYPVIDSALADDITGVLSQNGHPTCDYKIIFVGKSEAEGQIFKIGDYEVEWACRHEGKQARFTTPMFLTEGPYDSREPSLHQITIDILELTINLEEVLSTNLFFDHEKRQIIYESVTQKRLSKPLKFKVLPARSVPQALEAAVQFSYAAWNELLWGELMKRKQ